MVVLFHAGVLEVDQNNGDLIVAASLDYEMNDTYIFGIQAEDMGVPSRSGSANVTIIVLDVNDHTPEFNMTSYSVELEEGDYTSRPFTIITVRRHNCHTCLLHLLFRTSFSTL